MLKTITKKFLAIMLTFAMLCTILISGTTEIKAADKFVNIMHKVRLLLHIHQLTTILLFPKLLKFIF